MLSTLLNYRTYTADLPRSIARVEGKAEVEREAAYYAATIGSVRTVDDLMADRRLLAFALKAHGLGDQADATALVRKVLESDTADASSFVNRLSDPRYRAFAGAFDFSRSTAEPAIQSAAQTERLTEAYSEHRVRGGLATAAKVDAFARLVDAARSVDDLLNDPTFAEMAARIAYVDPAHLPRETLREILLGRGGDELPPGLAFLGEAFSFEADGSLASGARAQSAAATAAFSVRYFAAAGYGESPQSAGFETRYFEETIVSVRSVEDLLDDDVLARFVRIAAGLPDDATTRATLTNLLSLPADDPNSPIARITGTDAASLTQRERLLAVRNAFTFENGVVPDDVPTSRPEEVGALIDLFRGSYPTSSVDIAARTDSFLSRLSGMRTVSDLIGRDAAAGKSAFNYILLAFDIDPARESSAKIRKVLTSDVSDLNSYVRRLGDARYERLAAAFNFDAGGAIVGERLIQSAGDQRETARLYAATFGADPGTAEKTAIRRDTLAYLEAVGGKRSLDDLLADDRVLDFALTAHGLEREDLSNEDIRRLLTSDLADPASFARAFGEKRYESFAASFAFVPDGRIAPAGTGVQDTGAVRSTQSLYLMQMLEEEAGATSEGTRLALYFLRKAPEVTTPLQILADKALFEVVRTALGLPASISGLDIDRQAAILESRIDFADFRDPKALDRFLGRFAALHDLNADSGADPVMALFGGGSGGLGGLF